LVVHVPDSERFCALVFGLPFAGIEEFLGQDPVVALHLPSCRGVYGVIR